MSIAVRTNSKRIGALAALLAAGLLGLGAASASAEVKWRIVSNSNSTVAPEDGDVNTAELRYGLTLRNIGDSEADGSLDPIVFRGTLPAGVTIVSIPSSEGFDCSSANLGDSAFRCENSGSIGLYGAGNRVLEPEVSVSSSSSGVLTSFFELSGGGAAAPANTADPTRISLAPPSFGVDAFDVGFHAGPSGETYAQAAGHPYALRTSIAFNTHTDPDPYYGPGTPVEPVRDVYVDLPPGLVGNPTAVAQCTVLQLGNGESASAPRPLCPVDSQVGTVAIRALGAPGSAAVLDSRVPLYSMTPPPNVPARFGFNVAAVPVLFDAKLRSDGDYGLTAAFRNISEGLTLIGSEVELWGVPADPSHDSARACPGADPPFFGGPRCSAGSAPRAFLRMPTSCTPPGQGMPFSAKADSWFNQGALGANGRPALGDPRWKSASMVSHEAPGYPLSPEDPNTPWGDPLGTSGCGDVPVKGSLSAQTTALDTETSSGLDVHVEVPNPGLDNPDRHRQLRHQGASRSPCPRE